MNTLLVSSGLSPPADAAAALRALVRREAQLDDLGYLVETVDSTGVLVVGSGAGLLDDAHAKAAMSALEGDRDAGERAVHVSGEQPPRSASVKSRILSSPRSTSEPFSRFPSPLHADSSSSIVLNDWAATELQARTGDSVTMEYYAWEEPGRLVTKTTTLNVSGVVPIDRGDRKMAPTYPGDHRFAHAGRLGSAVPGRPSPHPPRR